MLVIPRHSNKYAECKQAASSHMRIAVHHHISAATKDTSIWSFLFVRNSLIGKCPSRGILPLMVLYKLSSNNNNMIIICWLPTAKTCYILHGDFLFHCRLRFVFAPCQDVPCRRWAAPRSFSTRTFPRAIGSAAGTTASAALPTTQSTSVREGWARAVEVTVSFWTPPLAFFLLLSHFFFPLLLFLKFQLCCYILLFLCK